MYTLGRGYLHDWIEKGILKKEAEPSIYAYFQEFEVAGYRGTPYAERLHRAGAVEDYESRIVHRHEQTLSGQRKIGAKCWNIRVRTSARSLCYTPIRKAAIDAILDNAARRGPTAAVTDEYGVVAYAFQDLQRPQTLDRVAAVDV